MKLNTIYAGDCLKGLKRLRNESIQCCITSPPYWRLRDYGIDGQLGAEQSPEAYVKALVKVFKEVYRVLKPNGTLWLNLGDAYWGSGKSRREKDASASNDGRHRSLKNTAVYGDPTFGAHSEIKSKDLIGLPWMVAFALRRQGWYLRQDIIWHKINPMPESVDDRCTKAHEYIFLLTKKAKYYFDNTAIKTPAKGDKLRDRMARVARKQFSSPLINGFKKPRGPYESANRRSVWSFTSKPFKGAHTAAFPADIPELCIRAGSMEGDVILDPFMGAGTTAVAAIRLKRKYIGFELNPEYVKLANERIALVV